MKDFAKVFDYANDRQVLVFKDFTESESQIVFIAYHPNDLQNKMTLGYKTAQERNLQFGKIDSELCGAFLDEGMKLEMPSDKQKPEKVNKLKLYKP